MSGDGVVSVRLPRSLLGSFQEVTERQGSTVHAAARGLVSALASLTEDDVKALKEPPCELDKQRISLYVGWRLIDVLIGITRHSTLTNSSVFRRLLYGLLVTREIEFVQDGDRWKLRFVRFRDNGKTAF